MRRIVLGATLILAAPVAGLAQSADIPMEARKIAAPVIDAVRKALVAEAALPPPASTREKLERMGRLDQAGREAIDRIDFAPLPPAMRIAVWGLVARPPARSIAPTWNSCRR